jgi:hypothetical protein
VRWLAPTIPDTCEADPWEDLIQGLPWPKKVNVTPSQQKKWGLMTHTCYSIYRGGISRKIQVQEKCPRPYLKIKKTKA